MTLDFWTYKKELEGLKGKVEAFKKKNQKYDFLLKCLHSTGFGSLWTLYSGKKP